MNQKLLPGIFSIHDQYATPNLVPGYRSANEQFVKKNGLEYRIWDPHTSKPAAALKKGLKSLNLKAGMKVLYLGLASGKTASFFSDIVGKEGLIYGIDISERPVRDALEMAQKRGNIVCIVADSRRPETYSWIEKVDLVFQDVATNDQTEILVRNCRAFLKPKGFALYALKSRSMDVTKTPKEIYGREEKKLKDHFDILQKVILDPYEKDHCFFSLRMK